MNRVQRVGFRVQGHSGEWLMVDVKWLMMNMKGQRAGDY